MQNLSCLASDAKGRLDAFDADEFEISEKSYLSENFHVNINDNLPYF